MVKANERKRKNESEEKQMSPEQIQEAFDKYGGPINIDRLHLNNGRMWTHRQGNRLVEWNHKLQMLTFEEMKPGSGDIIVHTLTYDAIDSISFATKRKYEPDTDKTDPIENFNDRQPGVIIPAE